MARNEAAISILQFEGDAVTHLAGAPEGDGFRIEDFSCAPFDSASGAGGLRDLAARMNVAGDRLFTMLPRHEVTVRILVLPAREPSEIASMLELTASEFVPYPRESLAIKHRVLETLPSGESRVLLVLVPKEMIERHVNLLRGAGLEPQQIFLSTTCLETAALLAPRATPGRVGLVHLGVAALEVAVFDDGVLGFSRGVAHGAPWSFADPHARESIAYEVRDALSAFRRECDDGLGVSTLHVSADRVDSGEFAEFLAGATEKTCRPSALYEGLIVNPVALSGVCPLASIAALVAAAGKAPSGITLLPESVARDRVMRGVQRRVLRIAALAAVVLVALSCWFAQSVVQRVLLIRELRVQAESLAPSAEGVAAKQRSLQLISRQVEGEGGFLELLAAVATAAPDAEFNFTRIDYDRESGMELWGRARSKDLVLSAFLGNLRRLGEGNLSMLARAHSQYETASRERDATVFEYHVSIPALPGADGEGDDALDR